MKRPEQKAGRSHVAQRCSNGWQSPKAFNRGFQNQMSRIETRRSRHADNGKTANQESNGNEGNTLEQAAQFGQLGCLCAAKNKGHHQQQHCHRETETHRQQQGTLQTQRMQ